MSDETTNGTKPYVQRLVSNLKGDMDVELSPCTLLVGKSGAGKTAIVDSIALALRGEARSPGLGKKESELIGLAPPGAEQLYTTTTLSSGEVCQWATKGSPKTTEKRIAGGESETAFPAGVFVSDVASSLMLGDSKKLQQAMLAATGAEISVSKMLKSVPQVLHENLREALVKGAGIDTWPEPAAAENGTAKKTIADTAPHVITPADVTKAFTYIDAQKRALSKRIGVLGAESEVEEVVPLSEAELEELARLEELDTQRRLETADPDQLRRLAAEADQRVRKIEEQMVTLSPMGSVGIEKLEEAHATLEMVRKTQKFLLDKLNAAAAQHGHDAVSVFTCPVCATTEVEAKTLQDRFQLVDQKFKSIAERFEDQQRRSARWRELKEEKEKLRFEAERLTKKAQEAGEREPVSAEDDIRERLVQLRTRNQRARQESANKAVLPELKQDVENLTAIKEVLRGNLSDLVDAAAAVSEKRLNQFLPKNFRAKILVKGTKKDAIRIEVAISGRPHRDFRLLSGGQRATLITAVAAAMIPPDAPPVRIMVVDELGMDATTLRTLMNATSKSVAKGDGFGQAIFCTWSWSGKAPKGWSMIQITRGTGQDIAELVQAS